MEEKKTVSVEITSVSGDETIHQTVPADRYVKGTNQFLRYEESEPGMGRTVTLVKIGPDEIRVVRQGDIESEQTFAVGEVRPGFYRTPQGTLHLTTLTKSVSVELEDGTGTVAWSYDLHLAGEFAGDYRLELKITP